MIKAVLIDPYEETVSDIEYDGNYKSIYPHIRCHVFTAVSLGDDDVFVDDEGLLKLTPKTKFFRIPTYPNPLAGYGMIIGSNDDGDAEDVKHDAAYYRPKIHFLDMEMMHIMGYYK
jgi:hypothetical protein